MFSLLIAIPLVNAAICLAAPATRQVAPSGPCAHFPGGFDNASNFTLAALNRTLPNANTTGAPLVLGPGGAIDGAEAEVLSTWASFPFNQWPSLTLVNNGLTANLQPPQPKAPTVSGGASNGSEITFLTTSLNPPPPAPVYCAIPANTGSPTPFPSLAVNDHADLFSLCKTSTDPAALNNVFYNATADNFGAYDFNSCYGVTLQLIGDFK